MVGLTCAVAYVERERSERRLVADVNLDRVAIAINRAPRPVAEVSAGNDAGDDLDDVVARPDRRRPEIIRDVANTARV